ncbi:MAG: hypothetical protein QF502_00800 [Nitrospinaceae bacterium]|nr:hypothetical protein [Nitrospinaceae bacterium]|tara:strand:- start:3436 stop:3834 length:399 start_codon:yes stop_codon:yes gene_type:complete
MWLIISSVIIGSALVIFAGVAVKNKAAEYDLPFLLSPSGYLVLVGTVVFWAGYLCCYNGPEGQLTDFLMLSAISCIIWLAGMVINIKKSSFPVGILLTMYQILIYGLGVFILIILMWLIISRLGEASRKQRK